MSEGLTPHSPRLRFLMQEVHADFEDMVKTYPEGIGCREFMDYYAVGRVRGQEIVRTLKAGFLPDGAQLRSFYPNGPLLLWPKGCGEASAPLIRLTRLQAAIVMELDASGQDEPKGPDEGESPRSTLYDNSLDRLMAVLPLTRPKVKQGLSGLEANGAMRVEGGHIRLLRRVQQINPNVVAQAEAWLAGRRQRQTGTAPTAIPSRAVVISEKHTRVLNSQAERGAELARLYPEGLTVRDMAEELNVGDSLIYKLTDALLQNGWYRHDGLCDGSLRFWPFADSDPLPILTRVETAVLKILWRYKDRAAPLLQTEIAGIYGAEVKSVCQAMRGLASKKAISENPKRGPNGVKTWTLHRRSNATNPITQKWADGKLILHPRDPVGSASQSEERADAAK